MYNYTKFQPKEVESFLRHRLKLWGKEIYLFFSGSPVTFTTFLVLPLKFLH